MSSTEHMRQLRQPGFSLVEVVLALGITSFAVMVLIGLLSVSLKTNRQATDNTQAANTASHILSMRRAAPCVSGSGNSIANVILPRLNQNWATTKGSNYITSDGAITSDKTTAAFYATYQVGTNSIGGTNAAGVYLNLGWPAMAGPKAENRYEIYTTISW